MREDHRAELAKLLEREAESLTDAARFADDLALDSIGMMLMLSWLEGHGVQHDMRRDRPETVGELLSLVDKAKGMSLRVVSGGEIGGPASIPKLQPRAQVNPLEPVLSNHTLRLTTVEPDDAGFLFALASRPETSYRWRYRGAPPSLERFYDELWRQVVVQFVARETSTNEPAGQLIAYNHQVGQRHVHIAAVFQPRYIGTGLAAQAVAMFVRYLFHILDLRKIYLEVPGFNWDQVRSGEGTLFQVEGVLRDHDYFAGRHWDQYLCAIYPEGK